MSNLLDEKKWFIYLENNHQGPFSLNELTDSLAQKAISEDHYVWKEGMADWQMIKNINEFNPAPQTSPDVSLPKIPQKEEDSTSLLDPLLKSIPADESWSPPKGHTTLLEFIKQKKWFFSIFLFLSVFFTYQILQNHHATPSHENTATSLNTLISDKLPMLDQLFGQLLGNWISPVPALPGLNAESLQQLRTAVRGRPKVIGVRTALVGAQLSEHHPTFYVTSNLSHGAQFEFILLGKPETLIDAQNFKTQINVTLQNHMSSVTFPSTPVPQGEYLAYLLMDRQQPPHVQEEISSSTPKSENETSEEDLPIQESLKNKILLLKKEYFLGGIRDLTYFDKLKEYQEKARIQSNSELIEFKQILLTLESQLESTKTKFSLAKNSGALLQQKKLWDPFHEDWSRLETQLEQTLIHTTTEPAHFHSSIFEGLQHTAEEVKKLHELHHSFFNSTPPDLKNFETQLNTLSTTTNHTISALILKIEEQEKKNTPQQPQTSG